MSRLVPVLAAALIAFSGCGGAQSGDDAIVQSSPSESEFAGGTVMPLQPAPELGLKNVDGTTLRVADLNGTVTLVTFVYANCPDICNLIIENMKLAKKDLADAGIPVRLVAVSVDPTGDTAERVERFLRDHQAEGVVDYLIGTRAQLEPVWRSWAVAVQEDFDNPALVEHSGVVWVLDADTNRAVYFPVSAVKAADLVHDVRVLAGRR